MLQGKSTGSLVYCLGPWSALKKVCVAHCTVALTQQSNVGYVVCWIRAYASSWNCFVGHSLVPTEILVRVSERTPKKTWSNLCSRSSLEPRIKITTLLVKMRMGRTEAANKNATERAVRRKSFINTLLNTYGHRIEGVKNACILYMYIFRCRKRSVQLYSNRERTQKNFIRCTT